MFCPHCGTQLGGGEHFCPICGAAVAARLPQAPYGPYGQAPYGDAYGPVACQRPGYPPRPQKPPMPDAYYAREFEKVAAAGNGSFNWAAFFLGPWHCLYRGCVARFLKLYLPLLLVNAAVGFFAQAQLAAAVRGEGGMWYAISIACSVLCALAWLGAGLYNGFTFNRAYYARTGGNAAAPARPGLMCAGIAAQAALSVLMVGLMFVNIGAALGRSLRDVSGWMPDMPTPYDEAQEDAHNDPQGNYDALFATILESHAGAADTVRDYTEGYTVPRAWPGGTPNEMMLRASRMFADDDVSVGTLLAAGMQNIVWGEEYPADDTTDGWNSQVVYGEVGQTAVQLEFCRKGECVCIASAITYLVDDSATDSYYVLSLQETAAFVQWLCGQASAQEGGMASRVRGEWASDGAGQIDIDMETLDGEYYELLFVESGALVIRMDSGEYRSLLLEQEGQQLIIRECDEDGTVTGPQETYYRV